MNGTRFFCAKNKLGTHDTSGAWLFERGRVWLVYVIIALLLMVVFIQIGIHKGRALEREEISAKSKRSAQEEETGQWMKQTTTQGNTFTPLPLTPTLSHKGRGSKSPPPPL